ncbi:MAG TPA: hypothetical protein VHI77_09960 [Solirubrobacterales bacterium]|nr:hypothetical protein [Solirubrobacterales bacterium]
MAVGLRMMFQGGTAEQYDTVNGHIRADEDPPEGLIFHVAGPIEGGWGVADVWESRDHFDRFLEGRLGPAIAELGDRAPQSPPDIQEFQVHHYLRP